MISLLFDNSPTAFFESGITPVITKIVHTHDNPYWFFNYHMHTNITELVYVKNGRGVYTIDNVPYKLVKDDILIVNPNTTHSVLSDKDHPLDAYNCSITDIRIKDLPPNHIIPANAYPLVKASNSGNFFLYTLQQILAQRKFQKEAHDILCNLLASALIIRTNQLFAAAPVIAAPQNHETPGLAHDVLIYISENYQLPLTLESLSRHFHISQGRISHAMKSCYQISPINHLISCRLTASLWLLISTTKTVTAISQEVGYENARHFTNIFIKRVGIPPLEFRTKYQPEHIED